MDAPIPSARWQKGEEPMRRVKGVVNYPGGFADGVFVERVVDGG